MNKVESVNMRIAFLCPYFGKINTSLLKLWYKTCEYNPTMDFLIITDDEEALACEAPKNVKLIKMSWDECKALFQSQFDFEITFAYAYKLCDLKPAYGLVFSEYLKDYDFWGHIDSSDTILGDLRHFVSDELLSQNDKIHIYGHFTLYRNTAENNLRFMIQDKSGITIEELFSREEVTGFDEMWNVPSINTIWKDNGFSLAEEIPNLVADILPHKWRFGLWQDREYTPRVFEWNEGKLFELTVKNRDIVKREIGYVHFQKRRIENLTSPDATHFYIVPNRFIDADRKLTAEDIVELSKNKLYLAPIKGRFKRFKWYFKLPKALKRRLRKVIKK